MSAAKPDMIIPPGRTVPFRAVVAHVIGGGWGNDNPSPGTVPVRVIRGTDFEKIRTLRYSEIPLRYEVQSRVPQRLLAAGDIVLEISGGSRTSGQATGRTLLVTPPLLHELGEVVIPASFCRRIRLHTDLIDPRYAFYCLQEMYLSGRAGLYEQQSTGISNFQFDFFLDSEDVFLPSLPQQRNSAEVLGSFDDKIECNQRMSRILEAIVRALFQSWFVDFDPVRAKANGRNPAGMDAATAELFPSHFEDSQLGKIPCGWTLSTFGAVAENPRRGCDPSEVGESMPYIGLEHLPRRSIELANWGKASEVASQKFRFLSGEILFGKLRPYFHKVGVAAIDGVCSTDILVIRPRSTGWFGFVLGHASSGEMIQFVDAAATGTRMPRTKWQDLARFPVVLPPLKVVEAFNEIIVPLIAQVRQNIHESRTLAALRDALLPKLVSGEVRLPA